MAITRQRSNTRMGGRAKPGSRKGKQPVKLPTVEIGRSPSLVATSAPKSLVPKRIISQTPQTAKAKKAVPKHTAVRKAVKVSRNAQVLTQVIIRQKSADEKDSRPPLTQAASRVARSALMGRRPAHSDSSIFGKLFGWLY